MGPPTFWDYAVTLHEKDVVDFIGLLQKPAPVRFLVAAPKRCVTPRISLAPLEIEATSSRASSLTFFASTKSNRERTRHFWRSARKRGPPPGWDRRGKGTP